VRMKNRKTPALTPLAASLPASLPVLRYGLDPAGGAGRALPGLAAGRDTRALRTGEV